ncbi:MAG: FHA domain-containing protein [Gemmatimonadaceae bacterium]
MPVISFGDQTRPVGPGVLTIGCAPEATWRIQGHDLEPIHAIVVPERGGRTLLTPGTPGATIYVNGVALPADASHVLAYDDRLRLGVADLVFRQNLKPRVGREPGFLYDRHRDRLYRLDRDVVAIGRDVHCGIFIQDPEVSRDHAEVVRRGEGEYSYVVVPKSAVILRNGERVISQVVLEEGDELTVGRTRLRFSWDTPRGVRTVSDTTARPAAAQRASRLQTTYIGTVESRARFDRDKRRRISKGAATGIAIAIVASVLALGLVRGSLPQVKLSTTGASSGR